ncbi:MAG: BsuBI/PstI family type II restriction endonuclease [Caulobacteraceae bacterium]
MSKVDDALAILTALGFPSAQRNERSALCLLALVALGERDKWGKAASPLMGITPIMEFVRATYRKGYAPNTRETIRRQTMHQFVEAGLAVYNPDEPTRAVNSPKAVYQIEPSALALVQSYGSSAWFKALPKYLAARPSLAAKYARHRDLTKVPVKLTDGETLRLSPGPHSKLIKAIVEEVAPRFVPGGQLIYAGDTGDKLGFFDAPLLVDLGVEIDTHGKMPDAIIYYGDRDWLLLIEAVSSHGPVDAKRHDELSRLFANSTAGLVYVTAFPDRPAFSRHANEIAWETEVWIADNPDHLIHFNGERFLGPY